MATPVQLLAILEDLTDGEFKKFKWFLQQAEVLEGFPPIPKCRLEKVDRLDTIDVLSETYNKNIVEVMIKVLKMIQKNDLVERLATVNITSDEAFTNCQRKLKSDFRKKFQHLFAQTAKSGEQMFNEIYTELQITEEKLGEINVEQEQRQTANPAVHLGHTVDIGDLFESLSGQDGSFRTLMTKGVAGIGKTVMTQRFALDWAEDKAEDKIYSSSFH